MDERITATLPWMRKVMSDLQSAKKLASGPDPIFDAAVYHCQQAAEKAVKGFLVFHGHPFKKIHDVEVLANEAAVYDNRFAQWYEIAAKITPYGIQFRYPSESEPEVYECEEVIKETEGFIEFIFSILPPSVRPSL